MTTPPTDQLIGHNLGRYRVERLLGRGATGSVYLAADSTLNRSVVIKTLHPHLVDRQAVQERFLNEARRIAALDHPHIVQVFDVNHAEGYLYFVMPYLESGSLRDYLRWHRQKKTRPKISESLHLAWQVAQALNYAHGNGVLHRDVKPGNVLLRRKSHTATPGYYDALLADFGIAVLLDGMEQGSGLQEGTVPYMAPEQCKKDGRVDRRSDLYALGVMLYEMLTGRLPYVIKTMPEAIAVHRNAAVPHPVDLRPSISPLLNEIVVKCLQKDADDRYINIQAFMNDITRLAEQAVQQATEQPATLSTTQGSESMDTSEPETATQYGKILWRIDNGASGVYDIHSEMVVMGRSKAADLTLDDEGVSRRHATLTRFSDGRYELRDLESRNGSYLANTAERITEPIIVYTGREVLLGHNVRLAFELDVEDEGETKALPPLDAALLQAKAAEPLPVGMGGDAIVMALDKRALVLEPGERGAFKLTLRNVSERAHKLRVRVGGVPETWVHLLEQGVLDSDTLTLQPDDITRLTITIVPPRRPASEAGNYDVALTLQMLNQPRHEFSEAVTLTLRQVYGFDAVLRPKQMRAGRATKIGLRHRGNGWTTYQLEAQDATNRLRFTLTQEQVSLTPQSTQANITLRHSLRRRPLVGKIHAVPFMVTVREDRSGGAIKTLQGEALVKPRMRPRTALAAGVLLLLLLMSGALVALADADGDGALSLLADSCPFEASDTDDGCPVATSAVIESNVGLETEEATLPSDDGEALPTLAATNPPAEETEAVPTLAATNPPAALDPLELAAAGLTSNADWTDGVGAMGLTRTFEGVEMVLVPAGCFQMGSDAADEDEQPVHEQCLETPFWIDATEVTQAQFERLEGVAAGAPVFVGAERPRDTVSWTEARDFCALRGGSLPTEAQWAFAARGPDSLVYPWGDAFAPDLAIGTDSGSDGSAQAGSLPDGASWVGALDLSGNLWEWTSTLYAPAYPYPYQADDGREEAIEDPTFARVIRGGSWLGGADVLRSANRDGFRPDFTGSIIGFRCVLPFTG